jgi:hypothetical protein
MKKITVIIGCLLLVFFATAQTTFTTIVPQSPVIEGEAFQVQYVIDDEAKASNFNPPEFKDFKIVAGPNVYPGAITKGGKTKQSKNFVFTLLAATQGRFIIPAASIMIDGKLVSSNQNFITVISREDAAKQAGKETIVNTDYFLRPGENVQEKIKQNLFVKVMVDKKHCYVGEPVLATFKLYSRLESKSDIIKNPGLYGFTIYDMVNLADKQVATEYIKGKPFDVHIIRKVQLYPLRAGQFTIDAMEINNKVEFSRSAVNKKTEQEIVEGVLGRDDSKVNDDKTTVVETDISTEPVIINVKHVPEKNKPANYAGAVGRFSISSSVVQPSLKRNEEGFFEVTISGKGNFIQLGTPDIQWPAGVEGFDPQVKDVLDKTTMPLQGSRTFRYPFTCAVAGNWQLPAVSFSFFDIDSNTFKTIAASGATVSVSTEEKKNTTIAERKTSIAIESEKAARKGAIIVISLVAVIVLYWLFRKKGNDKPSEELLVEVKIEPELPETTDGNNFYSILHQAAWKFLSQRFQLQGSEMNKQVLAGKMNEAGIATNTTNELLKILQECEAGMFTQAEPEEDKNELLDRMKKLLENINSHFQ